MIGTLKNIRNRSENRIIPAVGISRITDDSIEKKEYCLIKMHRTIMSGMVANKEVATAEIVLHANFLMGFGILSGSVRSVMYFPKERVYTSMPRVAAKDIQNPASTTVPGIIKISITPDNDRDVKGSGNLFDSQDK